jgi:uncharacterized integral membrane protein
MVINKIKGPKAFKDFGYKVIRLKYFILVVSAMLLEIIVLVVYIITNERIVYFNLFTGGILYGATSIVVVVLAVGCIALVLTDKSRSKKRITQFNDFRSNYYKLFNMYSGDIKSLVRKFDEEKFNFEEKVNYAIDIAEQYNNYLKKFSEIKAPGFLKDAFNYEKEHLTKEKLFFTKFSLLSEPAELEEISSESNLAYENFKRELNSIERKLKLII